MLRLLSLLAKLLARARHARGPLECAFFTRLPPEVRQLIYIHVLGGISIPIEEHWHHDIFSMEKSIGKSHQLYEWQPLALLLTCRQIYDESINILYSSNIFMFYRPRNIYEFALGIRPQSRDTLRKLYLQWHICGEIYHRTYDSCLFSTGEFEWRRACKTIAELQGLQELYIRLENGDYCHITYRRVLYPMAVIKRVQNIEVEFTWDAEDDWGDVPFSVRRPVDQGSFGMSSL